MNKTGAIVNLVSECIGEVVCTTNNINKGVGMSKKGSIVKLVSGCINEVVAATENVHRNIAETTKGVSKSGFQEGGRGKKVYGIIKMVNGKVEELISGFLK
jgi:hypothetical protein